MREICIDMNKFNSFSENQFNSFSEMRSQPNDVTHWQFLFVCRRLMIITDRVLVYVGTLTRSTVMRMRPYVERGSAVIKKDPMPWRGHGGGNNSVIQAIHSNGSFPCLPPGGITAFIQPSRHICSSLVLV